MHAETLLNRQAEAVADRQAIPALLTQQLVRKHFLPLGERTFWRWVSTGQFPKPDLIFGGKSRFWKKETVENYS
jgi:predicted DNA-binding transcriptional regulator AlpA